MQYVVIVPNDRKRIKLLPNVAAQFSNTERREIMYTSNNNTDLIWQLLVNMTERDAIKILEALEMEDNAQ